jgi:hypothetical protein
MNRMVTSPLVVLLWVCVPVASTGWILLSRSSRTEEHKSTATPEFPDSFQKVSYFGSLTHMCDRESPRSIGPFFFVFEGLSGGNRGNA